MSHEFETGMFVHEKAWHGLGTVVDKAPSTTEAIKIAVLDWTVKELPLITYEKGGSPKAVEGFKCLRRSDNDAQLHVCRNTWTPVQNSEAFGFFDPIIAAGDAKLDAAISLHEGRRVVITAKLNGAVAEVVKGDPVEQYLVLHNCHDASMSNASLGVQFSNIRVVCANTLGAAVWDAKKKGNYPNFKGSEAIAATSKMVRLKHTPNISENLRIVQDAIEVSKRQFDVSLLSYQAMANKSLTTEIYRHYLTQVFQKELTRDDGTLRPITEYKHHDQLVSNFESGRGMDVKGVRVTLWGAFQSVTEFATHQRGSSLDGAQQVEEARNRLNQMWFGAGADLIDRAQSEALAML